MAELATGSRRFAVQVKMQVRHREHFFNRRVVADQVEHHRLADRLVEPSGSPATARTWFSNWLVAAPSIVQWPELWTAGPSRWPAARAVSSNNSIASTPT